MELSEKVKKSLERIKAFEPPEGYYLAFSGGKDSVVCKALLDMAGVKYDATYRVTSVDPPELVRFIKEVHPDVKRVVPRYTDGFLKGTMTGKPITMWNLIPKKLLPPTRVTRYCCEFLKESGGDGRVVVTGVRWAESRARAQNQGIVTVMSKGARNELTGEHFKENNRGGIILVNDNEDSRRMVEQCYKRHKTTVNPIIDWTDSEVWQFIQAEHIPYCSLYNEGFSRLGCIGCPLASKRARVEEFLRWPKYKASYLRAFEEMLRERERRGKETTTWQNATDVFNRWMDYDIMPNQVSFEDLEDEDDDI